MRPAVVLASGDRNDWVLCQVTSKPYGDRRALELCDSDFAAGGLRISSFVRPVELHRHIKSNCCGSWGVGVPLSSEPKRRLSSDRQTSAPLEIWNASGLDPYNVLHKVNEFNRLG